MTAMASGDLEHNHLFLGAGHERNERRTWIVIGLCGAMMVLAPLWLKSENGAQAMWARQIRALRIRSGRFVLTMRS